MSDMSGLDEKIERLINRKLDGELTYDERLELDRALIRSPEHRRMLEELQRIDALCGESIRSEVEAEPDRPEEMLRPVAHVPFQRHRWPRLWWLLPGAVAACLGWFTLAGGLTGVGSSGRQGMGPVGPMAGNGFGLHEEIERPGLIRAPSVRPISATSVPGWTGGIRDGRRNTGLYWVIGSDGNLYLIQVDRVQTFRRRGSASGSVPSW